MRLGLGIEERQTKIDEGIPGSGVLLCKAETPETGNETKNQ